MVLDVIDVFDESLVRPYVSALLPSLVGMELKSFRIHDLVHSRGTSEHALARR